jgi:hypothetical protein
MASPVPDADDNPSSSSPQNSSAASNLVSKVRKEIQARLAAHENDPPHREKIKPTPGPWPKNHGGPIRILSKDGVLTEYSKNVEQERLAKLAATNENEGEKKAESSS